jgi:uncharacterized repeat protein (TIGR02543 family)
MSNARTDAPAIGRRPEEGGLPWSRVPTVSPCGWRPVRIAAGALRGARAMLAAGLLVVAGVGGVSAQEIHVALVPTSDVVSPGGDFYVDVAVAEPGLAFNAYDAVIQYDADALTFLPTDPTTLQEGTYMTGACGATYQQFSAAGDSLVISHSLLCDDLSLVGPGQLYRLHFQASTTSQLAFVRFRSVRFFDGGVRVQPVVAADTVIGIGVQPHVALETQVVGVGTVARDPDASGYLYGTEVTLTAVPGPGYSFAGWSGDVVSTENPLVVTMEGDLSITATFQGVNAVGPEPSVALALEPLVPTPTSGRVGVNFNLPRDGRVRLRVVDVQGRTVALLSDGWLDPGAHHLGWDARAAGGNPPGLYFVRLSTPWGDRVRRLILNP